MLDFDVDVITVAHRPDTRDLAEVMLKTVAKYEPTARLMLVDNTVTNLGFAAGCNRGASQGTSPIIALFNPDTVVNGPFLDQVREAFTDESVVITGCRFGKPKGDLDVWGVKDWVVGAAMFIKRWFWEGVGGFDEQFWLYFEETDLIRQAETAGYTVRSIELPLEHASPASDPPADAAIKRKSFDESACRYYAKWSR